MTDFFYLNMTILIFPRIPPPSLLAVFFNQCFQSPCRASDLLLLLCCLPTAWILKPLCIYFKIYFFKWVQFHFFNLPCCPCSSSPPTHCRHFSISAAEKEDVQPAPDMTVSFRQEQKHANES